MKSVRLNTPLTLEVASKMPDGAGGLSVQWTALGTLWAQIEAAKGTLAASEGHAVARRSLTITVRGAPIGAEDRPQVGQRFRRGAACYSILSVSEQDPMGQYLSCACREELVP
ncbi:MAG: head-tail adaptor protein [Pseudomonadota bacterium]